MKSKVLTFLLLSIVAITGCNKSEFAEDGDYFYLSNDGAKMPVWVRGNFDSEILLITIHGGPGDGGMGMTLSQGFDYLEDDYMVAYWDQRFAGIFQGQPNKNTMTINQFIEDTEKIVQLIQHKYPNKTLFLLGHSWGGQLAAGYLGRDNHQDNFKGWIDLDGSIYGDLEAQLMKEWILERVPAELAEPDADIPFWQYIIDWYDENPYPLGYSDPQPYWYASALHGDAYFWENYEEDNPIPYGELIFDSMFSLGYFVIAYDGNQTWADEANFTEELTNITIPSLLLWGADDGIVPATVGDYVYENLATDESQKELVKIPECAHGPQNDQPEIFYQEVKDFIETYK